MNRALRVLSVFALVLFLACMSWAQAEKVSVTAIEIWDPYNIFGSGQIGEFFPDVGNVTCPGNLPTGYQLQPCADGSRMNIRGFKLKWRAIATDQRGTGWETAEVNANWDADGAGPMWGAWRKELDEGGTWEGTFEGKRSVVPDPAAVAMCYSQASCWDEHYKFVGHGSGGRIDGLQMRGTGDLFSFTLVPIAMIGSVEAEIVPPEK